MSLLQLFPDILHRETGEKLLQVKKLTLSGVGSPLSKLFFLYDCLKKQPFSAYIVVVENSNELPEYFASHMLQGSSLLLKTYTNVGDQNELLMFLKELQDSKKRKNTIFFTTPEFLSQACPQQNQFSLAGLVLQKEETIVLRDVYNTLLGFGYVHGLDAHLKIGEYRMEGGSLTVFPFGSDQPVRIDLFGDVIETISTYSLETKTPIDEIGEVTLYPKSFGSYTSQCCDYIPAKSLVVFDELNETNEVNKTTYHRICTKSDVFQIVFTSFPEDDGEFEHLRYVSVSKYYAISDFINDMKERMFSHWKIVLYSKHSEEILNILKEYEIPFSLTAPDFHDREYGLIVLPLEENDTVPRSFQNTSLKIAVLTDREIFRVKKNIGAFEQKTILEFLTSLKPGDYVVHNDHGIGRFIGIDKKTVDTVVREYIHIQYAGNDRLFIPTDQAGKVSRYIVSDDQEPRLTRLDSGEWSKANQFAKREAEKIAKELLEIYARRKLSTHIPFLSDTPEQLLLEEGFPYEETPGQLKSIQEVKEDMEKEIPMDRLLCGDVGFGKTEVAVRAAFKAFASGRQVALLSPVTILADQHYQTFTRRLEQFSVRVDVLSRFKSQKEQKITLEKLAKGEIDIIIGTHRLLQKDVLYKNLGLVIIDEEQKFGVKQKEELKSLRANVDILTMTATPIPRTLNLGLNKLRDISTITTPPPGRLPVVTEVRKYNESLIRDTILYEIQRGGQIFFLHNKVQTIEGLTEKLRMIVPEAKFVVAHGQMESEMLEDRIREFKEKKYDVLVSSTIIENGIDLPNANTLIVNNADEFGLSQLYQLRGRVGRGRAQAFTYLLYQGQRLSLEAKKRLRAIIEASELGSGFQIAMKDLEIRGAGDILGVSQHGVMKSVGVGHFIRLLNQTVEDMRSGKISSTGESTLTKEQNVTVELPLTSFIPETYISDYKEKIALYQKMSTLETLQELSDLQKSVEDEYGTLPIETKNLFKVLEVKALARESGILSVRVFTQTLQEKTLEMQMSKNITPLQIMALLKEDTSGHWIVSGDKLKISLKNLGFDWHGGLVSALKKMLGAKVK